MGLTCQGSDENCKSYGPLECLVKGLSKGCKLECENDCPPEISMNKGVVTIYLIIITILGLIATAIVSFSLRRHNSIQFVVFALLLLFTIWVNSMIIDANPFCIFKACLKNSDVWVPISSGAYAGSKSILGITVNIQITFLPKNKVQLDSLTCSGKICPVSDLLQYCKGNKIINISTEKTRYGYPLTGECLDEIKKETDVIENIWAVKKGNDISVQLLVKVGGAHLNISVPLIPK